MTTSASVWRNNRFYQQNSERSDLSMGLKVVIAAIVGLASLFFMPAIGAVAIGGSALLLAFAASCCKGDKNSFSPFASKSNLKNRVRNQWKSDDDQKRDSTFSRNINDSNTLYLFKGNPNLSRLQVSIFDQDDRKKNRFQIS